MVPKSRDRVSIGSGYSKNIVPLSRDIVRDIVENIVADIIGNMFRDIV